MIFLTTNDLSLYINSNELTNITQNNANLVNFCELYSIDEATAYITSRYDTSHMFRPYFGWTSSATYQKDDRVLYQNDFYLALEDNVPATSITVSTAFEKRDDRPLQLVMIVADLLIYHLLTRVDFSTMSDNRKIRYENAIKKLKEFVKGTCTLPNGVLREKNVGNSIIWGSRFSDTYDPNEINTSNRKELNTTTYNHPRTNNPWNNI